MAGKQAANWAPHVYHVSPHVLAKRSAENSGNLEKEKKGPLNLLSFLHTPSDPTRLGSVPYHFEQQSFLSTIASVA